MKVLQGTKISFLLSSFGTVTITGTSHLELFQPLAVCDALASHRFGGGHEEEAR